jgi:hypothetical protein
MLHPRWGKLVGQSSFVQLHNHQLPVYLKLLEQEKKNKMKFKLKFITLANTWYYVNAVLLKDALKEINMFGFPLAQIFNPISVVSLDAIREGEKWYNII